MGALQDYIANCKPVGKIKAGNYNYVAGYNFWLENLMERAMRLLVIKTDPVPKKEVYFAIAINGTAGVTDKYKRTLSVFAGNYCGEPTQYYDMYKSYSVYSPVYSAILAVDKQVVVIDNNRCRTSIYPLCHRYASLLSHVDVTLANTLINARDAGGTPVAGTKAQAESIKQYRNSLCNGTVVPIMDTAFLGVQFAGSDKHTFVSLHEIAELRRDLLCSFYNDLGVRTTRPKKGNMIVEEIMADDGMLLLNLDDMLESWRDGFDRVNKRYGTNWSVDLAPELQYRKEVDVDDVQV